MSETDIYLLGTGIRGPLQFTDETIQAIRASRVAFVLHDDTMVLNHVEKYCKNVEDLIEIYREDKLRSDIYRQISELLVCEASIAGPVSFIVHGHPLFLVSAAEYTLELARGQGLRVKVLPAVSSFDTILCALEVDYGYGLQLFEATSLIKQKWTIQAEVPLLVFQLATVLQPKVAYGDPKPATLKPLVDYLLDFYPGNHLCKIVHSAAHLLERDEVVTTSIGSLGEHDHLDLWKRPTLYVPPVL